MRNPVYESALDNEGVKWRYEEAVLLEGIDVRGGLANQARLEQPLDEEARDRYAAEYRRGAPFPPVVLYRPGRGRFKVIDGNTRLAAAPIAGRRALDAYVVETDDQMVIDRLTWSFNHLVNGRPLSYSERLRHAVSFVRRWQVTVKSAAAHWGVSATTLANDVRAAEVKDRLDAAKVPLKSKDSRIYVDLAGLEGVGDEVLVAAAKAVAETGATRADTQELVKRVKAQRTHAAKLATIADYASSDAAARRRAETKGGTIKRAASLPDRLLRAVREALKLLEGYDRKALLPVAKSTLVEARRAAADLTRRLTEVYGLGSQAQLDEEVA